MDHHFLLDENEVVQGLYIQDAMMKDKFQKFPEVILVDSTHKTNLNDMPLFVILCIDGNGDSHVVAAFLVHHEDEVTVREMVKVFKAKNPASGETSVIITDKDMTERGIFKTELPDIELQICLFHVLRTFGREVTIDKLGITSGERQTILAKLQELTYARTEEDYEGKYLEFLEISPNHLVTDYFNNNWHNIKSEWVEGRAVINSDFCRSTLAC